MEDAGGGVEGGEVDEGREGACLRHRRVAEPAHRAARFYKHLSHAPIWQLIVPDMTRINMDLRVAPGLSHGPRLVAQGAPRPAPSLLQPPLPRHPARALCPRLVSPGQPLPRSPPPLTFPQETDQRLAALNSLKWSVWSSRGAGLALAFDAGLLLVPMLRNAVTLLRPKLACLFPADENVWFHRQVAYSMAFWTVVHTTAHYVNFFNVELARKSPHSPKLPLTPPRQSFAQRLPSTFTTPRQAASPATLCSSSCSSFTPPPTTKFVTSASRLFGTLTTSPSSSSSLSTHTRLVASSATPSFQTTS